MYDFTRIILIIGRKEKASNNITMLGTGFLLVMTVKLLQHDM